MAQAIQHRQSTPAGATFGGINTAAADRSGRPDFIEIQQSTEFIELRRRLRRFVFPVSALFFSWYMTYVLLAAYAPGLMRLQLFGEINLGLAMGVLQFITTVAITTGYARFAAKKIDPQVDAIRKNAGATPL